MRLLNRMRINQLTVVFMCMMSLGVFRVQAANESAGQRRTELNLSGTGWYMWCDTTAKWENDELFLPPVDLAKLPVNPPVGGWEILSEKTGTAVSVPGSVEEYINGADRVVPEGKIPFKDYIGVSWWFRTVNIPKTAAGQKLILRFDSVRLRAEVYVNRKLVAYDMIGNTPFEADITGCVTPGEDCQLALRITDPGGNCSWQDFPTMKWGKYKLPTSHGFGGITGDIKLLAVDPVYVDDIYVQNTPAVNNINVVVTLRNTTAGKVDRTVELAVYEKDGGSKAIAPAVTQNVSIEPGTQQIVMNLSAPQAKLWDVENPNLYKCSVVLKNDSRVLDEDQRLFGFRWFALDGIGTNATVRLNGKRIFLRTAISWSFWPANGISPTLEQAIKQIQTAKDLGLNMLNFHRCIGAPIVMEKADEMGLLYYEEPGGYISAHADSFAQAISREKLLRMVKRDRSHPCVVIYNMINEQWADKKGFLDDATYDVHKSDIRLAHAVDPSRLIVYTSAWADKNERAKLHMRPFDDTQYFSGWWDTHRAPGPETWNDSFYENQANHYGHSGNKEEVVYWGEEGAMSAPPRLQLIKNDLEKAPRIGLDGALYLQWYQVFDEFLTQKNLRSAFKDVDALCCAMGAVSLEHQGRKIEDTRICDANDGYAINGWESQMIENHSGIVDCFRNPKADPELVAYYNQPLYVAIKTRSSIIQGPGEITVDYYAINEKNLKGSHTLLLTASDSSGKETFRKETKIEVAGGDVYGQLVSEGVKIPFAKGAEGKYHLGASLINSDGTVVARGRCEVLAVNWKEAVLPPNGAIYEAKSDVSNFLKQNLNLTVPAFDGKQGKLDWILVARPAGKEPSEIDEKLLFERARKDGTTIIIANNADTWKDLLISETEVKKCEPFEIGKNWVGGQFFVKDHPLFRGLPVNCALNWPYQSLVNDKRRYGLEMNGEELVAGCYRTWPFHLGTAVGIVPCGKGQIIVSTLKIVSELNAGNKGPADVARKLLCNYIEYAGTNSK